MKSKAPRVYKAYPHWDDEFATGNTAPRSLPMARAKE